MSKCPTKNLIKFLMCEENTQKKKSKICGAKKKGELPFKKIYRLTKGHAEKKERIKQERLMPDTKTKSSKMTQLLNNDKQNRNIQSKSHELWHSLESLSLVIFHITFSKFYHCL